MQTPKVNKQKLRRDFSKKLADDFIKSGTEYGCMASVTNWCRDEALAYSKTLLNQGINLSKSNYPFAWAGLMADMFTMDAAKIVHQHFYPK